MEEIRERVCVKSEPVLTGPILLTVRLSDRVFVRFLGVQVMGFSGHRVRFLSAEIEV